MSAGSSLSPAGRRAETEKPSALTRWNAFRQDPRALWAGLAAVHVAVFLLMLPMMFHGELGGDLPVYRDWANGVFDGGSWPVLDFGWVYPAGAVLPVVLPRILGPALYGTVWLVFIAAANAAALEMLIRRGRLVRNQTAAGFWVLTVGILCTVDLMRLEGFTAPAVVIGMLFLVSRPRIAGMLLAIATWVKVWPAAVIIAVAVTSRRRWSVVAMGIVVSVVVVGFVLIGGGSDNLDSFVTQQNGRPLQVEAPLATPWLWMTMFGVSGAHLIHDRVLLTEEVTGPGDAWLVAHGTSVLLVVMAALVVLLVIGTRRLTALPHPMGKEVDLVLVGALALATAFIVFNKVASPQYLLWLTPIAAVGLVVRPPDWRVPSSLLIAASVLTTLVYPTFYFALLLLDPYVVLILALRNVVLVVVLLWAVVRLWRAAFAHPAIALGTRPLDSSVRSTSY